MHMIAHRSPIRWIEQAHRFCYHIMMIAPHLSRICTGPFPLALVLTLANAAKPVVVDDTAYLFYARQIAQHPLDPYGFELFWYDHPSPAMEVLAPPVLPYWLGLGVRLFGENLLLLKFWLFPFVWLFCWSLKELLNRFASGWDRPAMVMLTLSPFALTMWNFMLDLPALALGLASLVLYLRGGVSRYLLAGLLLGPAMQTKYTMLTMPVVIMTAGLLSRRFVSPFLVVGLALIVAGGWEGWLIEQYGVSHFLTHSADQGAGLESQSETLPERIANAIRMKWNYLGTPLLAYSGVLMFPMWLVGLRSLGGGRWLLRGVCVSAWIGFTAIALLPNADTILLTDWKTGSVRLDLAGAVFLPLGVMGLVVVAGCVWRIGRRDRESVFLIAWLLLEVAAYFVLTPFPAARRLLSLCVVVGLIVARWVSRCPPERRPSSRLLAVGVSLGWALYAMDVWDANVERELAVKSSQVIRERSEREGYTVWTQGHWGWQYYCDREGLQFIDPGRSVLHAGDWCVLPILPNDGGFYRPNPTPLMMNDAALHLIQILQWDDRLSATTIPTFYGGFVPFRGRDHARLRVGIYRVKQDWVPILR